MPRQTDARAGLPTAVTRRLVTLGQRMRDSRIARDLTQAMLADAAFVERTTIMRLERGDPGISLAVLASVLFVLGLDRDLDRIADAATDRVLQSAVANRQPRSAARRRSARDLDF